VEQFFGIPILQRPGLISAPGSIEDVGRHLHIEAAKRLVERDFGRFQKDAYSVSAKLTGSFLRKFPDLDVQSYRAALRGNHPLVTVLNQMILASAHILNKEFGKAIQFQAIQGWDENQQVPDDSYLKVVLSKYFVSKGVLTLRSSHSLSMTDSMFLI